MNTTPRLLNRLVLAVVGLLTFASGAAGLLLLTLPGAADWWSATAARVGEAIAGLRRRTTLDGQADTWLWIPLAGALLLLIVLLVLWIMAQGRGRTGIFASADTRPAAGYGRQSAQATERSAGSRSGGVDDGGTPGSVTITAAAAEQALKTALLERSNLAGATVSTWRIRGEPGLRVRVYPKKGTPPYLVAAEVSRLVEALDTVTGYRIPVLISISSGTRVRLSRLERVN